MKNLKQSSAKILLSALLLLAPLTAFSQATPKNSAKENSRSEVSFKQVHSSSLSEESVLLTDGVKIKMDLSVLEEVEAEREVFDPTEIPADDIYGGLWPNQHVNVYGGLVNTPDSFLVDLTNFTIPSEGYMTSNFGRRGRRYHYGVDIKAQTGDTIYAAFDGKIRVRSFERRGYGYYIVIRHVNGLETVYGHLSKFLIEENDFVKSGQPIGLAGNTGRSTGPHLHFETRFLGKPINPNFIIDFENKVCHRDEYLVTNSSFRKTTSRSTVVAKKGSSSNYQVPTNSSNKYVDGQVKYHRIRQGDTLSAISKRYGVSVKKLCSLNNMTPETILRIGKSIRIS